MSVDISVSRTVGDVFRRIKRTFGDMAGVQIDNTDILDWINDAQIEIAQIQRYSKTRLSADLNSGQGLYVISTLNILSIESLRIEGKPLAYLPLAEAEDTIMQYDPYFSDGYSKPKKTGVPQFWTLDQRQSKRATVDPSQPNELRPGPAGSGSGGAADPAVGVYLWPAPDHDVVRGLSLSVVTKPRRLSDESDTLDIPDKYFNALIHFVLMHAYELDEDHEAAAIKRQEFQNVMMGYADDSNEELQRVYPSTTYYEEGW